MRDAGRIGFDIKGNYDSTMKYEFLDVVYYQNSSYVAKKETTGNPPADNNEFWQIIARGESSGGEADASDMTVEFEQAVTMTNIFTGEKLSSLFGKIKKWFAELPGTRVVGSISTLTDFNQLNNTYRYWKISELDASYAEEIGIRNVGDFWAFILSYNGDGNTFSFGNIILTSPRLVNNGFYKITMWDGVPHVTFSRGYVPSLTNNFLATVPGQSALDAALGPAIDSKIEGINPLNGFYDASEGSVFDSHISDVSFISQYPSGIFGHSNELSNIIGYWVNVISHKAKNVTQISQIAHGELGTAFRYFDHGSGKWTKWTNLQQQINQLNSDLQICTSANLLKGECDVDGYENAGMVYRISNYVMLKAYFNGMHFTSRHVLFAVPIAYAPQATTPVFINCCRKNNSIHFISNNQTVIDKNGNIMQYFNSEGTATIWEGELMAVYKL